MARKGLNNYFSHDSNARNDEKLIRLRMKHGAAGYGVYFMILERLREETDYTSVKDYNIIAFDFRVDSSLVKSVIEDFGLFVFSEDGKHFYSESFMRRMELKDTVSSKRKDAAEKRWGKKQSEAEGKSNKPNPSVEPKQKVKPKPQPAPPTPPTPQPTPETPPPAPIQPYAVPVKVEVDTMKQDEAWKESVCIRYNLSDEAILKYFDDFALNCDKQHTSLQDAKSHFCRWLNIQIAQTTTKVGNAIRQGIIEQQTKEREEAYDKMKKDAVKPADYIRSYGYDPAKVTMRQAGDPEWRAKNPPTMPPQRKN